MVSRCSFLSARRVHRYCGFAGLSLALLLLPLAVYAQSLTPEAKDRVLKGMEDTLTRRAFVTGIDFAKWPSFMEKHRAAIDKTTNVNDFSNEVNRALREFGFSHIRLQTPRAAAARRTTTAIGIGVTTRKVEDGLRVVSVVPNGPAVGSGIETGDTITTIDGKVADALELLDGREGSKLTVTIKKANGSTRDVALERRSFSTVRPETLTWLNNETAVMKIYTFDIAYSRPNVERILGEAANAKYLVLDLRSNGGGLVSNMQHLLSLLLPPGTSIGTSVTRNMATRYATATKGDAKDAIAIARWSKAPLKTRKGALEPFQGRIAVLINRGSASASEITASALRNSGHAVVVGSNSAGAVLTSLFVALPERFGLQFPISDYISSVGVRLEANPIKPDVKTPDPSAKQPDIAADRAYSRLHSTEPIPVWTD